MINYQAGFPNMFREEIKTFCDENDIKISSLDYVGGDKFHNDLYNLASDAENILLLDKYIKYLKEI